MGTFLFDKVIFGPLQSRRLGLSLGVNLLSPSSKHCNFDCIYCECGWNADHPHGSFNSVNAVISRLEAKLIEMSEGLPNHITFAGNGEPTMHPQFETVIQKTIALRDRLAPNTKIAVLSNGTMVDHEDVRRALLMVDRNIVKLDSVIEATVELINRPKNARSVADTIDLFERFKGCCVVQTMFIRGEFQGVRYDNTSEVEVAAWLKAIQYIAPNEVMLYSIDRDTPAVGIEKVTKQEMELIAQRVRALGIRALVN